MKYFLLALFIPLTVLLNAQGQVTPGARTPATTPNNSNSGNSGNTGGKSGSSGSSASGGGSGSSAASTPNKIEKYPKVKNGKKLKIARQKMADGSYINAVAYLEDIYKDKPDKLEVMHLLGECNRYLRDYQSAEKYYKASVTKDPIGFINDNYWLGVMQKMNGKYEDAKKTLSDYLKTKLDKGDKSYKEDAKMDIIGCDSALVIVKNPSKIKVEKTEGAVNTPLNDYSPKPLKDGRVMFASQKTDTAIDNTTTKQDYYVSIFTAEKSGKAFTNRTLFPYPPNDHRANTSNAILSGDEKTLIYTRCADSLDESNMGKCKLYRTTKKNALEWNTPEELKTLNNPEGTTTHPAFGVDADGNDILYFVSNRKGMGSKGGLDIFYAKMNSDGTFGAITNAGPEVNTPADEITPFYDNVNKQLYFSSTGHQSIGGYDVFKISGTPGHWGLVINAGVPVNSAADDFYFALDSKSEKGFEVSNRPGTTSSRGATCCFDIWTVTAIHDVFLKGTYVMRGEANPTPVAGVDASLYKVNGNNFEFVANAKTTTDPFIFPVKRGTTYKINGNKENYWPSIDNLTVAEDEDRDTIVKVFYLDPIIKVHIKIPNVYFAFDKSNVITFYQHQIDSVVKVLNDHPGYTLEIQGHTDSKGSDEYNEKLSMRRANEVKDFLIKKKGVAENRVVAKWFGKRNPAVPNELPNGEDDPEGRARNRRVEFHIIPDKPEDAPEIEYTGEPIKATKTGPGFTYGKIVKQKSKK
jgi:outer membrane protein OmpA-like peptidoglycan-associated protein/tetratricopeptide (TPR) repeat protein